MTLRKSSPISLATFTCALALLLQSVAGQAVCDDLVAPAGREPAGFSARRLARIAPWYQARFDSFTDSDGALPGAVIAVARGGRLAYLQAIGFQDRAKTIPMKTDAIFWIASMSKPVTSVAAMILVDDGKLDLDAPVARYLPELGGMQVAVRQTNPVTGEADYGLVPPKRPMTVRDLMRHTSGLIYPELDFAYPERGLANPEADAAIRAIHLLYGITAAFRRDRTLAKFVSSLARLPLAHQPGEVHEYGWNADVLGRVIEVASGQPLDRFMQSRIFAPLRMVDTGFFVPEDKRDRLVEAPAPQRPPIWEVTTPPKLFSGGGGLVSTALDYLRFCQMLLNGGELDGVRVLSSRAVAEMTTDALSPDIRIFGGDEVGARAGTTFGLGFGIRNNPVFSWVPGAVGSFSWAGHWGTYFWVDPSEQLIGLQMIQALPGSKARQALLPAGINHLVYGALSVSTPSAPAAPSPIVVGPDALADAAGTYDFGSSVSSRDRQGLADGKTGWLGIEAFVAMEPQGLRINRPIPGSPAAKAGLRAGDLVTENDGTSLQGLSLGAVLTKLRGVATTSVSLKVIHEGQDGASEFTLVRAARRANTVQLQIRVEDGRLVTEAVGAWPLLAFEPGHAIPLTPIAPDQFMVDDEDRSQITFIRNAAGKVSGLVLNPGPHQQQAAIIPMTSSPGTNSFKASRDCGGCSGGAR